MAEAVILAAGMSTRAGTCKLALEVEGIPVIRHTIDAFLRDCSRIIVVLGHHKEKIASLLPSGGSIILVENEQYEKGMFSSVQCGVAETTEDFLICPGDIPGISPETVRALIKGKEQLPEHAWGRSRSRCQSKGQGQGQGQIRIPLYNGKSGHPVFFSKELKDKLLAFPVESNLREFIASITEAGKRTVRGVTKNPMTGSFSADRFIETLIETGDRGILEDIDTMTDYERFIEEK